MSGRRRGFTLAEVLLAIGLVAALAGGVFSFMWNLLDRRGSILQAASEADAAGVLFERIEADLLCAIAGDEGVGAGIVGESARVRVLTWGVALGAPVGATAAADLQGSEYVFDAARGEVRARRWTGASPAGGAGLEVVSDRVQHLRLRYFTGREWVDRFDSLREGLPVAVEVSIWFGAPLVEEGVLAEEENGLALADAGEMAEPEAPLEEGERPRREADRRRVIVVPDGPVAAWKEGA